MPETKTKKKNNKKTRAKKNKESKRAAPETMQELMSQIELPAQDLQRGDIVEGTVLALTDSDALVDLGIKSEGILPFSEFKGRSLAPGDKVLVYVLTPEDRKGQIRLSLKKAGVAKAWLNLKEAMAKNSVLKVVVSGHNKGGLTVDIFGKTGFIPFSHLVSPPDLSLDRPELQSLLDKMRGETLEVICLEADVGKDRIILSERLAREASDRKSRKQALEKVEPGQVLEGRVSGILPYGLSVDINGAEGLVELSELAWQEPEAVLAEYAVGQEVRVQVLSVDKKLGRLRLSVKETKKDPWFDLVRKLKPGSKFSGEVIKISSLGVSLRDEAGVAGLIELAELPDEKREIKIGERMDTVVKKVDKQARVVKLEMGK